MNDIFLVMFWDCVVKFKYLPPNTHRFCLSIVSHDLLCFAGNKNWYVCLDANISCKLISVIWQVYLSEEAVNLSSKSTQCSIRGLAKLPTLLYLHDPRHTCRLLGR